MNDFHYVCKVMSGVNYLCTIFSLIFMAFSFAFFTLAVRDNKRCKQYDDENEYGKVAFQFAACSVLFAMFARFF